MDAFPSMKEFTCNEKIGGALAEEDATNAFRDDAFFGIKDGSKESKNEGQESATQGLTNEELEKSVDKILDNIPKLFVFDGPKPDQPSKIAREEIITELKNAEQSDQLSLLVAKANLKMAEDGETNYLRIMSTPNMPKKSSEPAYWNHYEVQLAPIRKWDSLITDFVFDGKKTDRPNNI